MNLPGLVVKMSRGNRAYRITSRTVEALFFIFFHIVVCDLSEIRFLDSGVSFLLTTFFALPFLSPPTFCSRSEILVIKIGEQNWKDVNFADGE